MKHICKTLVLSCAFLSMGFVASQSNAFAADDSAIKVQLNNDLMNFPDAQPFVDGSNRTQVPIRFVSEKLGYQVNWSSDGHDVKVTIKNRNNTIVLKTGDNHAFVNGNSVSFDTNAVLSQDRTFVPLRFVSETLGSDVQWDQNNQVAIIATDGKQHQSAYKLSVASKIASSSKQFIGVPYVWGGTTPNGFDCSGFVRYVFQMNGVELPRTSIEMYSLGTSVFTPKTGDLMFFTTNGSGSVSHVGISLGNNEFISATSSRGIQIESLSNPYWGPRYLGARHILQD